MLQQTQVKVVLPYYRSFLREFPSLKSLSRAPLSQVLKAWEGMGYYARARHLHRAARWIVRERGGRFPDRFEEILALPGIGRSTAGAIASFAFGEPHPILDANARRVLSRLFDTDEEDRLWEISGRMLPSEPAAASEFLQALMDLGALVCLAGNPRCDRCPLASGCLRRGGETVRRTGVPKHACLGQNGPKRPTRRYLSLVLLHRDRIAVRRRPLEGLLGGLWEFPTFQSEAVRPRGGRLAARRLAASLGVSAGRIAPLGTFRHHFTHFSMSLDVLIAPVRRRPPKRGVLRWLPLPLLLRLPLPAIQRRVAEAVSSVLSSRSLAPG